MLAEVDRAMLAARVRAVESRTGVQVVTAVVPRAAAYPELAWKAFALAVALAGLGVAAFDTFASPWPGAMPPLAPVLAMLAAGGVGALAAALAPRVGRLFLPGARREAEVRRCAEALFLEHDLARCQARTAVLLLVARFERRVELCADRGFAGRMTSTDWHEVIAATTPSLARGEIAGALAAGLDRLESLLLARGFAGAAGGGNELPDAPLEAATEG